MSERRRLGIALALVALLGGVSARSSAVTGGRPADVGEYPAQVALLRRGVADTFQAQYCGGTLIDPSWVLTAGHCLDGEGLPDVLLGTTRLDGSGSRVASDAVFVPADLDQPADSANDIGLVHLQSPAVGFPTARLAYEGLEILETPGTPASVTGWGGINGDEGAQEFPVDLYEGDVPVISDADCNAALADYDDSLVEPAEQVCAGIGTSSSTEAAADACRGDSGGALWVIGPDRNRRQVGIVVGGPTCGFSPTYYTSVEAFIPFIEATTGLQLASFSDIMGDTHEVAIERVALAGITQGRGGLRFGAIEPVSRGQMAAFLARALGLPPTTTGPFSDVAGTQHELEINAVAAAEVAGGFPDGTFRPSDPVSRGQMAAFLARARDLAPLDNGPFSDVAGTEHERDINAVAAARITTGFPDGTFRPTETTTRAQMAGFLFRAFLDGD